MNRRRLVFINIAICLSLLLVASAFQACNRQMKFTQFSNSASESNNGTGYDGKLASGTYGRIVPNVRCQDISDNVSGLLSVSNDTVQMMRDECTPIFNVLDLSDSRLFYTPYNRGILAINGAIFELKTAGAKTDYPIVEAWCSSSSSATGVDVVIHSNEDRTQFKAKYIAGQSNSPQSGWNVTAIDEWGVARTDLGGGKYHFENLNSSSSDQTSISLDLSADASMPRVAKGLLKGSFVTSAAGLSLKCFTLDSDAAIAPRPSSLKGAWTFDHTHGYLMDNEVLLDVTSYGNQGLAREVSPQGLAVGVGRYGSGLTTLNDMSYVDVSALASKITGDMSLSLWVSKNDMMASNQALISSASALGSFVFSLGFNQCDKTINNEISVLIGNVCLRTGQAMSNSLWHHIGLTIQLGRARLYVDGVMTDERAVLFKPLPNDKWSFGRTPSNANFPINAGLIDRIDEVLVWGLALSDVEINRIYEWSLLPGRAQSLELKVNGNPQTESYSVEAILLPLPADATVDFYVDGVLKSTQGMPPFSMFGDDSSAVLVKSGVGQGNHVITAKYRISRTNQVLLETSISISEGPAATAAQ